MASRDHKSLPVLGFLTVISHPQHGLFGGYLLLNFGGRPLEFHCTAPVKPNRAQEILFGPTLEPYLYGEQIGQTLVNKAEAKPLVVCTDAAPMLAVREHIALPVAWIEPPENSAESSTEAGRSYRVDRGHDPASQLNMFALGRHRLAVSLLHADDRELVTTRLEPLADRFDLSEPFARIREAIEEAQRSGR
jgi:hypothetical protein